MKTLMSLLFVLFTGCATTTISPNRAVDMELGTKIQQIRKVYACDCFGISRVSLTTDQLIATNSSDELRRNLKESLASDAARRDFHMSCNGRDNWKAWDATAFNLVWYVDGRDGSLYALSFQKNYHKN